MTSAFFFSLSCPFCVLSERFFAHRIIKRSVLEEEADPKPESVSSPVAERVQVLAEDVIFVSGLRRTRHFIRSDLPAGFAEGRPRFSPLLTCSTPRSTSMVSEGFCQSAVTMTELVRLWGGRSLLG